MTADCPICGCRSSCEIFRATKQPAMLNRLFASHREALAAPAVDLHFRMCDADGCGFVRNAAFNADSVAYAPGYINDQSHSPAFRTHLDQVREHLTTCIEQCPGDILEIGCGQGDFLRSLCVATGRSGVGFDPALVGATPGGPAIIFRSRFDEHIAFDATDCCALVVCRHVLEHLPRPRDVLRSIASLLMRRSRHARLYIEVPCFDWIVRHAAFFDLFNEHCSLFTSRSLRLLLVDCGFVSVRIERVFGGQYLAAEASLDGPIRPAEIDAGVNAVFDGRGFLDARERLGDEISSELDSRPCALWGAGAKGVSLVNHLGLDHRRLPFLIDINPAKHNRYVPITAQQVIAPADLGRMKCGSREPLIYIMNPNYEVEIRAQLAECGVTAETRVLDGGSRVALHR